MSLQQIDLESVSDTKDSTIYTPTATPETFTVDSPENHNSSQNFEPVSDTDNSTIYNPIAISENFMVDSPGNHNPSSNFPSHNFTFVIRSASSGDVITLLDGQVVLAPIDSSGSIHWTCVESEGWLGFRNRASNKFLCHDGNGKLQCCAEQHDKWRHFTVTPVSKGGYIMQMLDWWTLRPLVINQEHGLQKLGRTGGKLSEGVVWVFIQVP